MAVKHGRKAELYVRDGSSVWQNWHQYLNKINHPQTVDNPEFPLFGKDAKQRIVGLEDTKLSCSGPRDVALETLVYALKGNSRAYRYFPGGSISGEPQFEGTLLLASYEAESDAEKENATQIELEVSDVVTRTVL